MITVKRKLNLTREAHGRRRVSAEIDWDKQRELWAEILSTE